MPTRASSRPGTRTLRELLRGADPGAQAALEQYFEARPVERIAWYPSSGHDYRDLLEFSEARRSRHRIETAPNIHLHTDYHADLAGPHEGVIHADPHTQVFCRRRHRLRLAPGAEVRYEVSRRYAVFPQSAPPEPTVYLLEMELQSDRVGRVEEQVLYFLFENYNFLEEIVLRHQLRVTHFVKVREGCGFGGCAKSISVFYSLLANLGVEYLLVDNEVHYCAETHDRIARRFGIEHEAFDLEVLARPVTWSGFSARPYRVKPQGRLMTERDLWRVVATIGRGWGAR